MTMSNVVRYRPISIGENLKLIQSTQLVLHKKRQNMYAKWVYTSTTYMYNWQISLHVQRRIRVDVGHVFGVKTNPYLKIKYTFEIFHQPAVKLLRF